MSTHNEIARLVLSVQFMTNSPVNDVNVDQVVSSFEEVLSDLSLDVLSAAFLQYRSTQIFFPSPGSIRDIAMDLHMLALGVPTAGEAWGMLLIAERHVPSVWCEEGAALREAAIARPDRVANSFYNIHMNDCMICKLGGFRDVFDHPAVEAAVKLLGGRDAILTDNPAADRARFMDQYREIIRRERTLTSMLPDVRTHLDQGRLEMMSGVAHMLSQ